MFVSIYAVATTPSLPRLFRPGTRWAQIFHTVAVVIICFGKQSSISLPRPICFLIAATSSNSSLHQAIPMVGWPSGGRMHSLFNLEHAIIPNQARPALGLPPVIKAALLTPLIYPTPHLLLLRKLVRLYLPSEITLFCRSSPTTEWQTLRLLEPKFCASCPCYHLVLTLYQILVGKPTPTLSLRSMKLSSYGVSAP